MANVYSEDSIKTLDIMTAMRLRPDTYVDGIGKTGLFKTDSEIVQNCFDENLIGEATYCIINHDTNTGYMRVEDDGRGIPPGKLEDVCTKAHTGGKFDRNAYEISGGKNGLGLKAANALSKYFKIEVWRLGYQDKNKYIKPCHAWMEFECGRKTNEFFEELESSDKHGTIVEYITDIDVMKTNERDIPKFREYLETSSYINPGIYIEYTVDGKTEKFQHTGGIPECLEAIIKRKKIKSIIPFVSLTGLEDMFSFDIVFTYHGNNSGDSNIMSAVNGFKTAMHGNHVSAFKSGIALAITQYIQETNAVPKSMSQYNVSGALISDNVVAVVSVRHKEPMYTGQTKDMFKSEDVSEPIKRAGRVIFGKWLRENPNQAKKLINLAIDYGKYEYERKKLKKNLVEVKQTKSIFGANSIDPTKFSSCRSNDPTKREIFFVEGDSAGGQVGLAQDRNFQALFKLRGKLLNVVKASKTANLSKVILDAIQVLGMGLPGAQKVNYDNLQYHKIVILTDADDDGAHIATLLLGFYYVFYSEIIKRGHVFIANPPIKKIIMSNGSSFYVQTDKDFDVLMREFMIESFDLYSLKTNKKLSKGLFRTFINACNGYDILLENHAASLAMKPELLERIIVYINILTQCRNNHKMSKEFYNLTGYNVTFIKDDLVAFDKGNYHATLRLNSIFFDEHFDKLVKKLNDIYIYGVYIRGLRSGQDYKGTIYELYKIMNSILGPKIKIQRFKGLGEMSVEDLTTTVVNPMTRTLTQVTMEDCEKAEKAVQIFLSDADIKFKRLFYAGERDFN